MSHSNLILGSVELSESSKDRSRHGTNNTPSGGHSHQGLDYHTATNPPYLSQLRAKCERKSEQIHKHEMDQVVASGSSSTGNKSPQPPGQDNKKVGISKEAKVSASNVADGRPNSATSVAALPLHYV